MTQCRLPTCLSVALALGCQGGRGPSPAQHAADEADHPHVRGKMLIADAGPNHALLTAHLSAKAGHELDVFIETADKAARPVALPVEKFSAQVTVDGGEPRELTFEPAPPAERPKDEAPGTSSHFVAKAPW